MTSSGGGRGGGGGGAGGSHPKLAPIPQGGGPVAGGHTSAHGSQLSHQQVQDWQPKSSGAKFSAEEISIFRKKHEITVLGNAPDPYLTFESTCFPPDILKELKSAGFPTPTPIQSQSWPVTMAGHDIVAVAKTGSGKTLGYLLPGFVHLQQRRNNPRNGPTMLVLAPTRELATQIHDEAVKFGRSSRIISTCVYGGAPKAPQLRDLDRGADIVIATPGRLNDFLEMKRINLRQVSYLVLDEADRMLDMGFEPQIRKIVNHIPSQHQTAMFTATWPKEVRRIAQDLLTSPVQVNIGNTDELVANKSITQIVELTAPYEKQRRLEEILRMQGRGSKTIIFCSTKRMCDQLSRSLDRTFGAMAIHGDKSQPERDHVLQQFRSGATPILVATDVAARGLDVKDIGCVVNYDFPTGVEDYVHRIGRTGRAGATGVAYTFFSQQDGKYAKELIKVLEGAGQTVPPGLHELGAAAGFNRGPTRWGSRGGDNGGFGGRGGFGGGGGGGSSFGASRGEYVASAGGRYDGGRGGGDRYDSAGRGGRGGDRDRDRDRYHGRDGGDGGRGRFTDRKRSPSRSRSRSKSPPRRARSRSPAKKSYSRSPARRYSRSRSPPYKGGRSPRRNDY